MYIYIYTHFTYISFYLYASDIHTAPPHVQKQARAARLHDGAPHADQRLLGGGPNVQHKHLRVGRTPYLVSRYSQGELLRQGPELNGVAGPLELQNDFLAAGSRVQAVEDDWMADAVLHRGRVLSKPSISEQESQ